MRTIAPVITIGWSILLGSTGAEAGKISTANDTRVAAIAASEASSRHRCVCRPQPRSYRKIRTITRYHREIRLHSRYPYAPWHSFDYFPRYYPVHPKPIVIVYRG